MIRKPVDLLNKLRNDPYTNLLHAVSSLEHSFSSHISVSLQVTVCNICKIEQMSGYAFVKGIVLKFVLTD